MASDESMLWRMLKGGWPFSGSGWDKTPPAPAIPDDVIDGTRQRYEEAYEKITGEPFSAWLEKARAHS